MYDFGQAVAELAVDGNTDAAFGDGSCTHTSFETNPWWAVDLAEIVQINEVEITNRLEGCK